MSGPTSILRRPDQRPCRSIVRRSVISLQSAFTLVELLIVIAIMGILAAISVPVFNSMNKGDATLAATSQLLADMANARQLAMSQRTTVYVIFLPADFWNDTSYAGNASAYGALSVTNQRAATKLFDKQLNSYVFVTLRSVGDQPGARVSRYLSDWRSLPAGSYIAPWKFRLPTLPPMFVQDPPLPAIPDRVYPIKGFNLTTPLDGFPFPSSDSAPTLPSFRLPYVAFNYLGQLVSETDGSGNYADAYIPLARGTISQPHDPDGMPIPQSPTVYESPIGNSSNSFNIVHIDWLTGRARLERQGISGP